MLALYEHPSNKGARPTSVTASILKSTITDVDASTSWTVNFSEHLQAQAVLSCSMTVRTAPFGATIRYKHGIITVKPPIFCAPSFTVQYFGKDGDVEREETKTFKYVGGGWHYEADEVARGIRSGIVESDSWGHEKSIIVMETFDEVGVQLVEILHANDFHHLATHRSAARASTCSRKASRRSIGYSEARRYETVTQADHGRSFIESKDV